MGDGNLKILDVQTQIVTQLTSETGIETVPVWSADGTQVYYRSEPGGILVKGVDGTTPPQQVSGAPSGLTQFLNHQTLGPLLLFHGLRPNHSSLDILILSLNGSPSPQEIVATEYPDVEPQVSPDGKWLAYASGGTGELEIYLAPFPPEGKRGMRISRAGGRQPMWRSDSRELFFVSDDRKFYAVKVPETGPSPDIEPQFLFDMHANVSATRNSYVPSRDGQRFLVNVVLDTEDAPINVISNWTSPIK